MTTYTQSRIMARRAARLMTREAIMKGDDKEILAARASLRAILDFLDRPAIPVYRYEELSAASRNRAHESAMHGSEYFTADGAPANTNNLR